MAGLDTHNATYAWNPQRCADLELGGVSGWRVNYTWKNLIWDAFGASTGLVWTVLCASAQAASWKANWTVVAVSQLSSCTPKTIRQVEEPNPAARIVLLANHIDLRLVVQAREAGVHSFCLCGSNREILFTNLGMGMLGESMLPRLVVRSILDRMALSLGRGCKRSLGGSESVFWSEGPEPLLSV